MAPEGVVVQYNTKNPLLRYTNINLKLINNGYNPIFEVSFEGESIERKEKKKKKTRRHY